MPNNILAFSVDLLAGSQNGEGARDINCPWRERDRPRWRGEDEGIYLVANLSWKYFEEAESHGMVGGCRFKQGSSLMACRCRSHFRPSAEIRNPLYARHSRRVWDATDMIMPTSNLLKDFISKHLSSATIHSHLPRINTSHTIVSTAIVYFHHAFRYQEKEAVNHPECAEQASRTRCLHQGLQGKQHRQDRTREE